MSLDVSAKGTIPFGAYRTWYRITGAVTPDRPALVVAHGGPGSTHDYLLNVAAVAEDGWPVVHYDQLGNGGSTHLPDKGADFWTVELFLDEIANLTRTLGVDGNYVLLGQSWGGVLAARHAAGRPPGLRGLILADTPPSYPLWLRELDTLRAQLPPGVDETLRRHEAAGTTASAEYFEAMGAFYARHVCRLQPWPRDFMASFMEIFNDPTVYMTMNGPSEFHIIGTLRDYSVVDCLADIDVPTLVLTGRHDEITPATIRPLLDLIPDVRWELFEESSHVPHLEEPERFRQTVTDFLKRLS